MSMSGFFILNGNVVSGGDIHLSTANRGLMYGDGCFETLRAYKGKFLRFKEHFERLHGGAKYLGLELSFGEVELRNYILTLLLKNGLSETDALIRVQVWREGGRGYFSPSVKSSFMITAEKLPVFKKEIKLHTVGISAIPGKALNKAFKLTNGINYIMASREAHVAGADDAVMLTLDHDISETPISNVFWLKNGELFTPSVACDILPGITRQILIELAADECECPVWEGSYPLKSLFTAEAVFCTNSVREIISVSFLDGYSYSVEHPVLLRLKSAFEHFKDSELN